jgi:MOSC domain-containing protein YiiM
VRRSRAFSAVSGPVAVRTTNLDGDGQSDLTVHGGRDKAVYAYSHDAYPAWETLRGARLSPGAFGENLTVDRLSETEICVGDAFRAGTAVLQAVQPRFPCFKLAMKFDDPRIVKQFFAVNRPGIYFRVLREGVLAAGDELRVESLEKIRVPVAELWAMSEDAAIDAGRAREILKLDALDDGWRARLLRRLD